MSELALSAEAAEVTVAVTTGTAMTQQQLDIAPVPNNPCYLCDSNLGRIYVHEKAWVGGRKMLNSCR